MFCLRKKRFLYQNVCLFLIDNLMIVCNLSCIKTTNGLYFYALDYIKSCLAHVSLILVSPGIYHHALKEFPEHDVRIANGLNKFILPFFHALHNKLIFTPSPHPIPFISNQIVVFHDSYPFVFGRLALLKKFLFIHALSFSSARVGFINNSEAKNFLLCIGIPAHRLIYMPNKFPDIVRTVKTTSIRMNTITNVALVGTDSEKKNYYNLFNQMRQSGAAVIYKFCIYGHSTSYYNYIVSEFPDLNIQLFESDVYSFQEFYSNVDILVSAATNEGFSRPIAFALLVGIPCFLLNTPVFNEFYNPGAYFYRDLKELCNMLAGFLDVQIKPKIPFNPPDSIVSGYKYAVSHLLQLSATRIHS